MSIGVAGIQIGLLEGFELTCDGQRVSLPLSAQRVLAFLALHGRPLLRAFVAGSLWADTTERRAGANLRSALWRLNLPGHRSVDATATYVQLCPDVGVDLRQTEALARGIVDQQVRCDHLEFAEVSLSGDLLPDWYDDWVLIERERFHQLRLHALESLCDQLTAAGRYSQAIDAGLTAIAGEPLRESAHRALIRAYLAEGNLSEALRQYHAYRRLLHDQLAVSPSPQMEALIQGSPTRR
ncbi:MAG: AfsR/SARP family transcriptional regulator [Egibacteraceae bacterium]